MFFIKAGTLHAIGKGILIAEIQQNSNTTYRVSDYGRLGADGKPRELHVKKAVDVTVTDVPTIPYGKVGEVNRALIIISGVLGAVAVVAIGFAAAFTVKLKKR